MASIDSVNFAGSPPPPMSLPSSDVSPTRVDALLHGRLTCLDAEPPLACTHGERLDIRIDAFHRVTELDEKLEVQVVAVGNHLDTVNLRSFPQKRFRFLCAHRLLEAVQLPLSFIRLLRVFWMLSVNESWGILSCCMNMQTFSGIMWWSGVGTQLF